MLTLPDTALRHPREPLTPADEAWLKNHYQRVLQELDPIDLGLLCSRLRAGQSLGLSAQLQGDLLCVAVARGILAPDETLIAQLSQFGIHAADDRLLIPRPIQWTLQGVMNCPLNLSLDSPVIHAFLVREGEQVQEILIVGRGCGEVRRRLYDIAFLAALASRRPMRDLEPHEAEEYKTRIDEANTTGDRLTAARLRFELMAKQDYQPAEVLDGLIWLSRYAVHPALGVPVPIHGGQALLNDPFLVLVKELRLLANESSLVEIHELSPAQIDQWRPRATAEIQRQGLLDAGLFYDHAGDESRTLIAAPGHIFESDFDEVLKWDVPSCVFESPLFGRIARTFLLSKAISAKADAQERLMFHKRHREEDEEALDAYKKLGDAERAERDKEQHRLNLRVDHELGVEFALRKPSIKDGQWYFNKNLPGLIASAREWEDRMGKICSSIEAAENDGRLLRLVVGYLLDRAFRNLAPVPGDPAWPDLESWQRAVRPLLLRNWESGLRIFGVEAPEQFATRRLFLRTVLREGKAVLTPHYLFVNKSSVLDCRGTVQRLVDRIDRHSVIAIPNERLTMTREALGIAVRGQAERQAAEAFQNALQHEALQSVGQITGALLARFQQEMPPHGDDPLFALHVLAVVRSYSYVGAFHAALRVLVAVLDMAPDPENPHAAGEPIFHIDRNRLPEIPVWFLMLAGMADPAPAKPWELISKWHKHPHAPGVSPRVRKALRLADHWEPDYLIRCMHPSGPKKKTSKRPPPRIVDSKALLAALKAEPTTAAVVGLLDQARLGIEAGASLAHFRHNFPKRPVTTRRMYRLLAEPLTKVINNTYGYMLDKEVQELCTNLLYAEHYLDEDDLQFGESRGAS